VARRLQLGQPLGSEGRHELCPDDLALEVGPERQRQKPRREQRVGGRPRLDRPPQQESQLDRQAEGGRGEVGVDAAQ
jgi:hypothetical protein